MEDVKLIGQAAIEAKIEAQGMLIEGLARFLMTEPLRDYLRSLPGQLANVTPLRTRDLPEPFRAQGPAVHQRALELLVESIERVV